MGGASGWDDNGTNSAHMPHIASKADPLLPMFGFRSVDEPHFRKADILLVWLPFLSASFCDSVKLKAFLVVTACCTVSTTLSSSLTTFGLACSSLSSLQLQLLSQLGSLSLCNLNRCGWGA